MQVDACIRRETESDNPWISDGPSSSLSDWESQDLTEDELILPLIGKRTRKRPRNIIQDSPDSEDLPESTSQRQQIVRAQLNDADTKTLVELVQRQMEPKYHEIRPQSQYLNHLVQELSALEIVNGELRKKSFDHHGNHVSLLVVPDIAAPTLIRNLHVSLKHCSGWRMQNIIGSLYFIHNLNVLLREICKNCEPCVLSQAPKQAKARRIPVFDSFPTRELNVDLLFMPNSNGYRYCLVAVDLATAYIFARKMRTKSSKEAASCLLDIIYSNSFLPLYVSSDGGLEFFAEFEKACREAGASHVIHPIMNKNSNKAESANSRLINLFKRSLDRSQDWPDQLNRIVFALNVTSMSYSGYISNPNLLFNARGIPGIPYESADTEKNSIKSNQTVRQIMTEVTKSRLLSVSLLTKDPNNFRRANWSLYGLRRF